MFLPHSFFQTICKYNSFWCSQRETPATSNNGCKCLDIPAQCPGAQDSQQVSGNPSQQVISSRQPVIYSKCLNEPKRVSSGLKLLVLADRCLHCFLLFNKICICHKGLQIFPTFVLFTWRQQNNEFTHETEPITAHFHNRFSYFS